MRASEEEKILKNLERLYQAIIHQENPLVFFRGLGTYIDYALKVPKLKRIFDTQMDERTAHYSKIQDAENKATKEMQASKKKLLKLIKDKSVDMKTIKAKTLPTIPPFDNVVAELQAFESGKILKSGFHSDSLQAYLFNIASNLFTQGYQKELGDLFVPKEDYITYYERLTERTSGYWFAGNEYGSFIFSKTWPERFEQEALLRRERLLKPWGSFEQLLQFKRAYDAVIKNKSFSDILENEHLENKGIYDSALISDDISDIAFMSEDLQYLMGQTRHDSPRKYRSDRVFPYPLDRLSVPVFRTAVQTAHNIFIQKLESEPVITESKTIGLYLSKNGDLYRKPKEKNCYPMGSSSDRYKLVKLLSENNEYRETQIIASELGNKNKQTVRTEIGKINDNAQKKLHLSENEPLIQGRKENGYRVNPKYKITPTSD